MQEHFEKVIGRLRTLEGLVERLQTVESGGGGGSDVSGWTEVSGWSYASATRINFTDANLILSRGDRIRYKQGGGYKYGYVFYTPTSTYFNVTGGDNFSVANAPITDAAFSRYGGVGHPEWFSYSFTPSTSVGTLTTASGSGTFKVEGLFCEVFLNVIITTNGTGAGILYAGLPLTKTGNMAHPFYGFLHNTASGSLVNTLGGGTWYSQPLAIWNYDGTYPGSNSRACRMFGRFQIAEV